MPITILTEEDLKNITLKVYVNILEEMQALIPVLTQGQVEEYTKSIVTRLVQAAGLNIVTHR